MSTRGLTLTMPATPCRAATGLTMAELECVVAVASCPPGMLATRDAIKHITGGGENMPTNLVERGVLFRLDVPGRFAAYGVRPEWARRLGIVREEREVG